MPTGSSHPSSFFYLSLLYKEGEHGNHTEGQLRPTGIASEAVEGNFITEGDEILTFFIQCDL